MVFHRHFIYMMGDDFIASKETALSDEKTLLPMPVYSRIGTIC